VAVGLYLQALEPPKLANMASAIVFQLDGAGVNGFGGTGLCPGLCPTSANVRQDSFAVGGQPHPGGNRQALTGASGFPQADLN